jgi:hypothetical protein
MKTRTSFTHTTRPSWKELKRLQREKERRAMRQWEQDQLVSPKICILCGDVAEDGHACEVVRHVEAVLREK